MKQRIRFAACAPALCAVLLACCPRESNAQLPQSKFSGTTFAERWAWADAIVVGKCIKTTSTKKGNVVTHSNTFESTRVLRDRSKGGTLGKKKLVTKTFQAAKVGSDYLLFQFADSTIGDPYAVPFSDDLLTYIRKAPSPAMAPSKRMAYFLKHLRSENKRVSGDALIELAGTAAKHYVALPKQSVDLLESSILDPTGTTTGSGDTRLIAGYLLVRGAQGLDRFDAVLKSESADYSVLYSAIVALDFVWKNGEGRIPQERMRKSLRLLIDKPEWVNHVFFRLTRWKDWSSTDRLVKLYGTKGYTTDTAKFYIIRHLLAAAAHAPTKAGEKVPAFVETARKHLAAIQKKEPAQVAAARKGFNPNVARRVTWRQGKLADPKIDKVATGLSGIPVTTAAVHVVRFHPDSKTLNAGSGDGSLRRWNVATGTRLSKINPHTTWCFAVAFSSDGERLATGGGDNFIRIFGTDARNLPNRSGVLHATLKGHTNDVHAVAFGPKRETLYSAGDDMVLRFWDLKTRSVRETLEGHSEAIPCLAISPDGSLIATGSRDDSIRIWDARTGKLQHLLTGHQNDVHSVAFSPDGKTLASASYDETVKLWDVATGNLNKTLKDHSNWVFSLAYSPDGKQIASADKDGRIVLWDAHSGKKLAELRRQRHVSCVTFSADGQYLASSAPSGLIALWSVKTRANVRNLIAN